MSAVSGEFRLDGKIAMVTASAKGIGRACAIALARAGADIVLGLRTRESAADLAEQIESFGRRVLRVQMDVSKMEQIVAAVDAAASSTSDRRRDSLLFPPSRSTA